MGAEKIIFLTGAPDASALSWDEADLTASLLPCFEEEIDACHNDTTEPSSSNFTAPAWRVLPLKRTHLHTGLTPTTPRNALQPWEPARPREEAAFLNAQCLSFISADPPASSGEHSSTQADLASEFLERSFAAYEDVPSSPVVNLAKASFTTATSSGSLATTDASLPSTDGVASTAPVTPARPAPPAVDRATLSTVPSARYLDSIIPQTVTVNLVVGVISIAPPRTIALRRGGTSELVEMTVGDESRAGFGVNLWLPPGPSGLRTSVERLRPRDVLLMRNVALGTFRGTVYGQSLRKDVTRIEVMFREGSGKGEERGWFRARDLDDGGQVASLVKRVREWVLAFVAT